MSERSEHDKQPPPVLWHYTDVGGLHGILESGTLWGTHVKFLNDVREIIHGYEYIRGVSGKLLSWSQIVEAVKNEDIWRPETPMLARVIGRVVLTFGIQKAAGYISDELVLKGGVGPFVTCLSGARDQLGQWRGYAGDSGYAIGFNRERLQESIKPRQGKTPSADQSFGLLPLHTSRLVKIKYPRIDEESGRQDIDNTINSLIAYLEKRVDGSAEGLEKAVENLPEFILGLLMELKDPAFKEEREYRIITFEFPGKFYPKSTGLIPRVEIDFEPECVTEILVGPGGDRELRKFSIGYFLKHDPRYSHVEVNGSDVPFRATPR
jgi:hypothetical protein